MRGESGEALLSRTSKNQERLVDPHVDPHFDPHLDADPHADINADPHADPNADPPAVDLISVHFHAYIPGELGKDPFKVSPQWTFNSLSSPLPRWQGDQVSYFLSYHLIILSYYHLIIIIILSSYCNHYLIIVS